jgi:hypothetical protein
MAPIPISRLQPSRIDAIEEWHWLDQAVFRTSLIGESAASA